MSYTVSDLNAAIEDEGTPWEGSWFEFEDASQATTVWQEVAEDYPGATYSKYHQQWRAHVPLPTKGVNLPGFGQIVNVESFGGEGQGDDLWQVFAVYDDLQDTRYFRKTGYYASFVGGEYDGDLEEVKPVEKTVTVYEKI